MWDLIVSVPDHCLSFYFAIDQSFNLVTEFKFSFIEFSGSNLRNR